MNASPLRVVAAVQTVLGVGLAVRSSLAGDAALAVAWAVVAAIGAVYVRRFADAGPARA